MFAIAKRKQQKVSIYSVRNSVLIISHITFWDCHIQIFSDNLSRNSCIDTLYWYNLYDEQYFCNVLFLEISIVNFA